jgi:hypothetical protein
LTCKVLGDITPLSFSRVFLSANSLDIEVFRAIADYSFRHGITEIIWDDARLILTLFSSKISGPQQRSINIVSGMDYALSCSRKRARRTSRKCGTAKDSIRITPTMPHGKNRSKHRCHCEIAGHTTKCSFDYRRGR